MPSNCDKKPKRRSDSQWYKAKDFVIRDSEMYDISNNAKLQHSENINASIVIMVDHLTGKSHVDQGEASDGLYDNYRRWRFSLI